MPPQALIVDDERLMREQVRMRLAKVWPELEIVAEAENGPRAIELFEAHHTDLAFLDIRMPGMSGLEVARELAGRCHIVFITAYDQHAIEAFEHGAVDYLLKPVDEDRLARTVTRLKERLSAPPAPMDDLLAALATRLQGTAKPAYLRWIKAQIGTNLRLIPVEEIVYFHAEDKYTRVFTATAEALIKKPIKELAGELDPEKFWQIHRATLVNASEIAGVGRDPLRDRMLVTLKHRPDKLEVSRSYTHLFKQM
jgi:DNA-binding LytR/AlgR family response regulator